MIVDPTSGRPMEGRRWSDGLHQSVEVKEGLVPSNQSEPSALVTYQALFRQWRRLCGMTGTAMTDAKEFNDVYGLRVTAIPTALPLARKDYDDAVYRTVCVCVRFRVSRRRSLQHEFIIAPLPIDSTTRKFVLRSMRCVVNKSKEPARPVLVTRPVPAGCPSVTVGSAGACWYDFGDG